VDGGRGADQLDAARLLIYRSACTARQLPNNVMMPQIKESSMAKAFTGHAALEVVSESLQMFGAAGIRGTCPWSA
jgi:alkylation response protein AidB-like acyl-CoA dehydrogenase